MNWSAFPYFRIAIVLALGIFTVGYYDLSYRFDYVLMLSFCLYLLSEFLKPPLKYQSFIRSILLLFVVFSLGATIFVQKNKTLHENAAKLVGTEPIMILGKIDETIKSTNTYKYILKTESFRDKTEASFIDTKVLLTFSSSDTIAAKYKSGDKIVIKSMLKPISKSSNPESFDYSKYLLTKGVLRQGFVKIVNHALISSASHHPIRQFAENTADFSSNTLKKYFKDTLALGIAEALLIGRKQLLSEEIRSAYVNTGAIHVLSVSGLHVAIFISLFIWLFDKVENKRKSWLVLKVFSLLSIAWFYVLLTGMSPSVVRAATMVSMYIVGKNFFKNTNTYNILAIAAIVMLLYNPYYLFQASFQFSFISLLSILYFQPKIKALLTPDHKVTVFCWDLTSVSIGAQILIFPFTVYFFHQFPVYFIISGLVAVPLVTIIIYLGTLLIISEMIFVKVSSLVSVVLEYIIQLLNSFIQYISNLPFGLIPGIWLSDFALFIMVLALVFFIFWMEVRSLKMLYAALLSTFVLVFYLSFTNISANGVYSIVFYDVYGGHLIDIFEGRKLVFLKSQTLSEKTETFATFNHRIKNRILTNDDYGANFYTTRDGDLMYFFTDLDDFARLKSGLEVHTLFVSNINNNVPEKILNKLNPKQVVLDSNLKPWIRQKWLTLSDEMPFKIHDIKSDGAFIISY